VLPGCAVDAGNQIGPVSMEERTNQRVMVKILVLGGSFVSINSAAPAKCVLA
jgi:hypothetical protein